MGGEQWAWLPEALQAAGGLGLIGATVAYLLRAWGDWKQRSRQRKGLLRLLGHEIKRNEDQLRRMYKDPTYITSAPAYAITTTAWEDVRATIAPLLMEEERVGAQQLFDIARYYAVIQAVNSHRVERIALIDADASATQEQKECQQRMEQKEFRKQIPTLQEISKMALKPIQAYFPDENVLNEADGETEDREVDT